MILPTPDLRGHTHMAEMPDLDPNEEHTPESLEAKLHEYANAVRSEFELAQSSTTAEDNAEQFALDFAKKNMGHALAQIAWLSQNSMSDSVRFNASKYITELAREDARKDGDPIKELLAGLRTTEPETAD
jgi:hypothetical protein